MSCDRNICFHNIWNDIPCEKCPCYEEQKGRCGMTCKDCMFSDVCHAENNYENFPSRCERFIPELPEGGAE